MCYLQPLFLLLLKSLEQLDTIIMMPSYVRLPAHGIRRRRGGESAAPRLRLAPAHSTRSGSCERRRVAADSAEAPRRQDAPFCRRREARGPAQRLSAPRRTLAGAVGALGTALRCRPACHCLWSHPELVLYEVWLAWRAPPPSSSRPARERGCWSGWDVLPESQYLAQG